MRGFFANIGILGAAFVFSFIRCGSGSCSDGETGDQAGSPPAPGPSSSFYDEPSKHGGAKTHAEQLKQAIASWVDDGRNSCDIAYLPHTWWQKGGFVEAVPAGSEESYLVQLGNLLHDGDNAALTDSAGHDLTLYGLGGVGKSSLALAYAHLACKHSVYDLIHWINAENEEQILDGYHKLLGHFGLHADQYQSQEHLLATLNAKLKGKKYLIVYDNVMTPQKLEGLSLTPSGHHLITSCCCSGWQRGLVVDVFSNEEAINYLVKSTGIADTEENRALACDIAAKVGHLPLALEHVGRFFRETDKDSENDSFEGYLQQFQEDRTRLPGYELEEPDDEEDDPELFGIIKKTQNKSVVTVWKKTVTRLIGQEDKYKCGNLLGYCSYLESENIPIDLFMKGDKKENKKVDTGLKLLDTYSMIKKSGQYVSVHPLVQWVTRQEQACRGPLYFADMFESYAVRNFTHDTADKDVEDKAITIVPHISSLLTHAEEVVNEDDKNKLAALGVGVFK